MFWWRKEVRPGISVAFSDDDAGNLALHVADNPDDVMARRARLEAAAGLGERRFQFMNQVHGKAVEFISAHGDGPTADAMVSRGQPLAVMVADCVPIVLLGEVRNEADPVLAVVHAGRPGVAADIVSATVVDMRHRGAATISAWVGPSICGECYEVPEELRSEVAAAVPETWSTTSWGTSRAGPACRCACPAESPRRHGRVLGRVHAGDREALLLPAQSADWPLRRFGVDP